MTKRFFGPEIAQRFADTGLVCTVGAAFCHAARRLAQTKPYKKCQQNTRQADDKKRGAPTEKFIDPAAGKETEHDAERDTE